MTNNAICACCGRPRTIIPIRDLDEMDALIKPRKEQLALDVLVMNYPNVVAGDRLKQALYEEVGDREPEGHGSLMAHISKLRKKIKAIGWDVEGRRFVGYRLIRVQSPRIAA